MNTRIFDLIEKALISNNNKNPFAKKVKGEWVNFSSDLYLDKAKNIAYGLINLGFKKEDNIILLSENRHEWNFVDLALQKTGLINVPVYATITDEQLITIVEETESELIFVSNKYLYLKVKDLLPKLKSIKYIYTFDKIKNEKNLEDLVQLGIDSPKETELKQMQDTVNENDIYTFLYTSGTTGSPKGVMLTHKSSISIIKTVLKSTKVQDGWKTINILPLNNSFGRIMTYMFQIGGLTTHYIEGITSIMQNLQEVKPQFIPTAPILLERILNNVLAQGNTLEGEMKQKFEIARNIFENFSSFDNFSDSEKEIFKQIDTVLFSKYRSILGGEMITMLTGGSKVSKSIFSFYRAIGINMLSGYGLTETSGLISIDVVGENAEAGKSGKVIDNMQVKIDDKTSEILAKGIPVMKGYYKHPELTAEVIDKEAWLHTGDVGNIDKNGLLSVIGRIKSSFKSIAGTFIYPEPIEEELSKSPFIENIIVTGINQYYLVALIVPNFQHIENWCEKNNISFNKDEIVNNEKLKSEINNFLNTFNEKQFADVNQVKKFKLLTDVWSIESGDITPTMKIKRNNILEKYKNDIYELYK